ncbi:MAG: hypothetical protein AB7N76_09470 [Planctomycetota bacterium]
MGSISEDGFIQDYELRVEQELWLYCRLCRRTFPVVFKPKHAQVKLQCLCGHEGPLAEMDVFRHQKDAQDHAAFYERVYRAAKGALKDAGIPLPPSGKYDAVSPHKDPDFESYFDPDEDQSAIEDGYVDHQDDSDVGEAEVSERLDEFERLLEAAESALARHEVLSELIEFAYVRRFLFDAALVRFLEACAEDIDLADQAIVEARQRMKQGEQVRISFSSFKHLLMHLEEEGNFDKALLVAERAVQLGLKQYVKKVAELRYRVGRG